MSANIVLMDFLYKVKDPLPEAFLLFCVIIYLLLQDYKKIVGFFFKLTNTLPKFTFKNQFIKNSIRVSAIIIPSLLLIPHYEIQFRQNLTGKYKITKMTVNGKEVLLDACNDSVLSNVYFDLGDYFVLMSNNYINREVGRFEFNEDTRRFKTIWQYPQGLNDTLFAKVSLLDKNNGMNLSGLMGKDTLNMQLLKQKIKSVTTTY